MTAPSSGKLPLVILGGRDRQGSKLPEAGRHKHPLKGYKGAEIQVAGRPLASLVAERFVATGEFGPVYVAGPQAVYEPLCPELEIIDTDGEFSINIRAALDEVTRRHPGSAVAFTTGDILPEPDELERLLDHYRRHRPVDFWFPQILCPEHDSALGASDWKPRYRIVPDGASEAVATLPSHLVIADPAAVRLKLVYRIFRIFYRTRNRSIAARRLITTSQTVGVLLLEDLRRLFTGRAPNITWTIVSNGLRVASQLNAGSMQLRPMEDAMHKVYISSRHRKAHPERRGWAPILPGLSLARDIDTVEEAAEIVARAEQEIAAAEGSP